MDDAAEFEQFRLQVRRTAHELANVLGIALNYVSFLADDLPPEPDHPARRDLPALESATERAVDLVRRLQQEAHAVGR